MTEIQKTPAPASPLRGQARQHPPRREILGALGAGAAMGATLLAASGERPRPRTRRPPAGRRSCDIGVLFKQYKRKDDLEKQINAKKDQLEAGGQAAGHDHRGDPQDPRHSRRRAATLAAASARS